MILCVLLTAVTHSQDTSTLREQRRRTADSLRSAWADLWKRSDSLRIESMYLRMRSDSIRKILAADSSSDAAIIDAVAARASTRRHADAVRKGNVKEGRTVSDSVSLDVLRVTPDTGVASFYADAFHGKRTSSGAIYDMNARTCAHRWLPFGTIVEVTNLQNGKAVRVSVTDRGPWKHGRLIDVSKGAAKELDFIRSGTTRVTIRVVDSLETDVGETDDETDDKTEDGSEER